MTLNAPSERVTLRIASPVSFIEAGELSRTMISTSLVTYGYNAETFSSVIVMFQQVHSADSSRVMLKSSIEVSLLVISRVVFAAIPGVKTSRALDRSRVIDESAETFPTNPLDIGAINKSASTMRLHCLPRMVTRHRTVAHSLKANRREEPRKASTQDDSRLTIVGSIRSHGKPTSLERPKWPPAALA